MYHITLYSYLPAFTALVFALLLLLKQERQGFSAKVMGLAMLCWSAMAASYVIDPKDNYVLMYKGDILYNALLLLVIPLHAAYFSFLTQSSLRLRTALCLFLPSILVTLTLALLYASVGEANAVTFIRNYFFDLRLPSPDTWDYALLVVVYKLINPIVIAESVVAMAYIYRLLKRYDARLSGYYSNVDDKNKPANYFVFYITLALLVSNLLYTAIVVINSQAEKPMLEVAYIVFAVMLFLLGRSVLNNRFSAADLDYEQSLVAPLKVVEVVDEKQDVLTGSFPALDRRLRDLLAKEPLYLQADLTLDDLAARLYTNRTYLSLLFNKVYGMPFYDYVNSLRVKHAEALLADAANGYSLEHIAAESGFSATSSFYRIFKHIHGCTPTAWRKNLRNERKF